MKRTTRRTIILVLAFCILFSTAAFAAVESSAYISAMSASVTFSGDSVNIYFTVVGRHNMTEIGVYKILLFEQNGNIWSKVYTFNSDDPAYTADMLSYNTSAKADTVTYPGSASKNYLAVIYFYAADNYGSDTIPYYAYS